jgi:hypothetical protein
MRRAFSAILDTMSGAPVGRLHITLSHDGLERPPGERADGVPFWPPHPVMPIAIGPKRLLAAAHPGT